MSAKQNELSAFGENVRRFRKKKSISQEALADLAKIDRSYMGGIERGERNPTLQMIHRIAKALDIPAAKLISKAS